MTPATDAVNAEIDKVNAEIEQSKASIAEWETQLMAEKETLRLLDVKLRGLHAALALLEKEGV